MAKKRSKKDRVRAKLRHVPVASTSIVEKTDYLKEIFAYDPKLILKDLRKTFLVVLFILIVLLAIFLLYT